MARIGFYGGTFNPIHMGHVEVCRQAIKQLRLDCLHVIPTFIPPHKATPDLAAGEDRLDPVSYSHLTLPTNSRV